MSVKISKSAIKARRSAIGHMIYNDNVAELKCAIARAGGLSDKDMKLFTALSSRLGKRNVLAYLKSL